MINNKNAIIEDLNGLIIYAQSEEFIPPEYIDYLENLKSKVIYEETIEALKINTPKTIAERVNLLFYHACKNTNLSLKELVKILSFIPSDIKRGQIGAFFAELRIINLLANWNFKDIQPVKKGKEKSVDIICRDKNFKYAVEIFYSSRKYDRELDPDMNKGSFENFLYNRATQKKPQIDSSMITLNCQKGICVVVFDSLKVQALRIRSDFLESIRIVYEKLGWNNCYHLLFFNNMVSSEGSDDCIYPQLVS